VAWIVQRSTGWIGGLDESKGALGWTGGLREHWSGPVAWMNPREHLVWTIGLDRPNGALDLRPHSKCRQMDYTKNCVVNG
jgi:hypothetical protein